MAEIETLRWGAGHVAYLDPMTGQGMLVVPDPRNDVWLPIEGDEPVALDAVSVQSAEFALVGRTLDGMGWTLSEPDDPSEFWLEVGLTARGETVVGLLGLDPIISQPTLDEMAEAGRELEILARLAR